jgi:hypothetical protein
MIKALLLILEPGRVWDRVVRARRGMAFILTVYLLPMILIATLVEGWGLAHWGKWQSRLQEIKHFPMNEVVAYELVQFVLLLATIFVCAQFIRTICRTFYGHQTFTQAFTVVAYGLSPMFLLKLLDIAPTMHPWVTWGIGITLSVWILYQGLPRVLLPDPTHAFGLYLVSCIVLVLATGTVRVLTGLYLLGNVSVSHSYLARTILQWFSQFHF